MEVLILISVYFYVVLMVKVGVYIFVCVIIDGGNILYVIGGVGMVMVLVIIFYGFLMYLL